MSKFYVNGSIASSTCSVEMSLYSSSTEEVEITLGVKEVLTALDDILSDGDQVKEQDFQKLLDIADQIQSLAVLRNAEKVCHNCKKPRGSCPSCKTFEIIKGGI